LGEIAQPGYLLGLLELDLALELQLASVLELQALVLELALELQVYFLERRRSKAHPSCAALLRDFLRHLDH
jgi:hypothetical protein